MRTQPRARVSFQFSINSTYAACLVADHSGGYAPERWSFESAQAQHRQWPAKETTGTQPLSTEDGRVLVLRNGVGRHELVLLDQTDEPTPPRRLVVERQGLRLFASPQPGVVALAIGIDSRRHATVFRVLDLPLRLEQVVALPGQLGVTCWLDVAGARLGAELRGDGRRRPVLVDLAAGQWRQLDSPPEANVHAPLLANPRTGLLLFASDAAGTLQLGFGSVDDPAAVRFPTGLNRVDGDVTPLAIDPTGQRLALRVTRGVRSELRLYHVDTDRLTTVDLPSGALDRCASWGADGLRVVHSAPEHGATVVTIGAHGSVVGRPPRDSTVSVQRFAGPAGEFEAVCYGDWRTASAVVVALHGGPEAAWTMRFEPTLHRIAAAGVAVVAPNQRGSIGYGTGHSSAIHGAWGGPDLADIRALVRELAARRPATAAVPMLYGLSYGAFLALLAAAADPDRWSRCAVVAAFLSGAELYADAGPTVRALIDRLGGRTELDDELGPRDLCRLGERVRMPLMIVHGERDQTIPVSQARQLRRVLLAAGRREGVDFAYHEVHGGGHVPFDEAAGTRLVDQLVDFLTTPTPIDPDSRPFGRAALFPNGASLTPQVQEGR